MYTVLWSTIRSDLSGYCDYTENFESFVQAVRFARLHEGGCVLSPVVYAEFNGKRHFVKYGAFFG